VIGERPFGTIERLDEPDPDGWLRIRLKLDWPNEASTQVLAVGPGCELLEPADLRRRVGEEARRLVAAYDASPDPPKDAVRAPAEMGAGR
jgi:predicted DNA-binding transcriptional regulator YafY